VPNATYVPKRPPLDPCPVEEVLAMVGGKWKCRLLLLLSAGPRRLADLRRSLPAGLANQVLLTQLRALAADGLVECAAEPRGGAAVARRYRLTPLGRSVLPVLDAVAGWGAERLRARGAHWTSPVPHPRAAAPASAAGV
jgi:DNA-binding HxlR family transcriptional regulator